MGGEKILVVDDDIETGDFVELTLTAEKYTVVRAYDGIEGLGKVRSHKPDMVLLDIDMPRMNGLEVCRALRCDSQFRLIPIIFLTASRPKTEDKVVGIGAGADDYLIKPFLPQELAVRIYRLLERTREQLSVNPLTKLPGSQTHEAEVTRRIEQNEPVAVCYFDLDNFKAFNDHYGYVKGNDVILLMADLLIRARSFKGNTGDCISHIGGDDMVMVTTPDKVDDMCRFIIDAFAESVPGFYSAEDQKRGYISALNRKGEMQNFPLMSLSIAVVSNEAREFMNYGHLASVMSEMKKYAKSIKGNCFVKDRRKDGTR